MIQHVRAARISPCKFRLPIGLIILPTSDTACLQVASHVYTMQTLRSDSMQLQDNQPTSFAATYLRALTISSTSRSLTATSNASVAQQHGISHCRSTLGCNNTCSMQQQQQQQQQQQHLHMMQRQPSSSSIQHQLAPATVSNSFGSGAAANCSFSSSSSSSLARGGSGVYVSPFAGTVGRIISPKRDQTAVSGRSMDCPPSFFAAVADTAAGPLQRGSSAFVQLVPRHLICLHYANSTQCCIGCRMLATH
jgi:hypothetical protein